MRSIGRLGPRWCAADPFTEPEQAFDNWRKVSITRRGDYSGLRCDLIREMSTVRWPYSEQYPRSCERLRRFNL
jgi:hypothetical protein